MLQLALGLLQLLLQYQFRSVSAIVVERNMFAYYKVPLRMLDKSETSTSGLYYVLQCPPKLSDSIPKPKDMPTCNVIDQYKDIWQSKRKPKKLPARTMLIPLPPPSVKRMRWGWRRIKRQNPNTLTQDEATPLQHLGKPHRRQKLLKLAADHRKLKRGSRTKGYHHMFHRDEVYNDHIFYDEMQVDGKYKNRGETKD